MANIIRCFVCGSGHRGALMPFVVNRGTPEEIQRRREFSELHREERRPLAEPLELDENTRICSNCNINVIKAIRAENDLQSFRFNVLVQRSSVLCFICDALNNLKKISFKCRTHIFIETGIFVPVGRRCCEHHLGNDDLLLTPLLAGLIGIHRAIRLDGAEGSRWMEQLRTEVKKSSRQRFENEENFTDAEFSALTPLTKTQFIFLCQLTNNVTVTAHGIERPLCSKKDIMAFMCKLRQGISDEFISAMFSYSSRPVVSTAIKNVRETLMRVFVPIYLGLNHITREDYINRHVTDFANQLYNPDPELRKAIAYLDATYSRIPKSSNFRVMRQSFCVHKGYHLLKPCMVVAPNGYILDVHGPYFSDSRNNDASMLTNQFENDVNGIRAWFQEGDIFIVDRGYRDAIALLERLGIDYQMPAFLQRGQRQHSTEEANASRLVTKTRWIIEARNGHIKSMFKFFRDLIPIQHVSNLGDFFRIACAIINAFHPTVEMQGANIELANLMLERSHEPNVVQIRVEAEGLLNQRARWIEMNERHLPGFPRLTLDFLRDLTFGSYQIKLAPSYVQDKRQRERNELFEFDEIFDEPGFLRVRIWSRHVNAARYHLFIAYNNQQFNQAIADPVVFEQDQDSILGYYCTCKAGARTLGCCAHVASVLWFLGFARHEENVRYPPNLLLLVTEDAGNRELPHIIHPENPLNNP